MILILMHINAVVFFINIIIAAYAKNTHSVVGWTMAFISQIPLIIRQYGM